MRNLTIVGDARMSIHNRTLAYASLGTPIVSGGTSREDYLESLEQTLPDVNTIFPHPLIWMRLASDPYLSPEGHQYTIFEDRGKCVTVWFTGPLSNRSTTPSPETPSPTDQNDQASVWRRRGSGA